MNTMNTKVNGDNDVSGDPALFLRLDLSKTFLPSRTLLMALVRGNGPRPQYFPE